MTSHEASRMHASVHLIQQTTVTFSAAELWPLHGAYTRFGPDLPSFAEEVTRRLRADGYVGFHATPETITVIPLSAVKRLDFTTAGGSVTSDSPE